MWVDVVKAHNWVYKYTGILHRDVSINNIMFRRNRDMIYGVINDFDLSFRNESSAQRTGSAPFMSVFMLSKTSSLPRYLYRYDLESFFYVFLFVCCSYRPTEKGGKYKLLYNDNTTMAEWLDMEVAVLRIHKPALFARLGNLNDFLKEGHPDFEMAKHCLKTLHKAFSIGICSDWDEGTPEDVETFCGNVSFDVFEKAIESLPLPLN